MMGTIDQTFDDEFEALNEIAADALPEKLRQDWLTLTKLNKDCKMVLCLVYSMYVTHRLYKELKAITPQQTVQEIF